MSKHVVKILLKDEKNNISIIGSKILIMDLLLKIVQIFEIRVLKMLLNN